MDPLRGTRSPILGVGGGEKDVIFSRTLLASSLARLFLWLCGCAVLSAGVKEFAT
jgi:hypothetical protein